MMNVSEAERTSCTNSFCEVFPQKSAWISLLRILHQTRSVFPNRSIGRSHGKKSEHSNDSSLIVVKSARMWGEIVDLFLTADLLMDHLYLAAAEAAPQTTNRISGPPILRNITNINLQVGHLSGSWPRLISLMFRTLSLLFGMDWLVTF